MKAILHNGQLVAFAHGPRIKLDPDLETLAPDHPERRWAMALATFACLIETGERPGSYTTDLAAEFARDMLLPVYSFVLYAAWSDAALSSIFRVPVEQIRYRRTELSLTWN